MKNMTHASLFSGIGGFDLAAEWMGWENAFHCEINEWCAKVLNYHFPKAKHYADITQTDFTQWRGKIDVLTGGFPCQPFSLAGQRKGADDDRYLWPQFIRVIREIKPTWVIGENVAGILTMVQPGEEVEVEHQASLFEEDDKETILEQEFVVETICRDLEREGYTVQPFVIPACAVGAPHKRDRVWFIAHSDSSGGIQLGTRNTIPYKHRFCTDEKCRREQQQAGVGRCIEKWTSTYGTNAGAKGVPKRAVGLYKPETTTYAKSEQGKRMQPEQPQDSQQKEGKFGRIHLKDDSRARGKRWQNFPTQSPVCSGDDGLSSQLDGITFSAWREESVKAYGNAIVPQVACELFTAIEIANKNI